MKHTELINIVNSVENDLGKCNTNINTVSKREIIELYNSTILNNREKNLLTISTFNIKSFKDKASRTIKEALLNMMTVYSDVCCVQECLTSYEFNIETVMSNDNLCNVYFRKALKNDSGEYGNAITSNLELTNLDGGDYSVDSGIQERCYQKADINFNGHTISIYNTHLSVENDSMRISQIDELKNAILKDINPYKIICGDFNTNNVTLLEPLKSLGFDILNTGQYGTYKNENSAIDNILFSNNLRLVDSGMYVTKDYISDHNLLYVKLEVK